MAHATPQPPVESRRRRLLAPGPRAAPPSRAARAAAAVVAAALASGLSFGGPDPGLGGAPAPRAPGGAEPKRIYIANDEHTDYMWTADDVAYRQAFLNMLDYYMDQAEATSSNPPDARGRFNCDGSLWVWEYERNRSSSDFARLLGHLRAGTISMPLQTCVMLYGAMPLEAVLRNMYYAGRLERREGLRFPLVVAMENQTLPGGVASLWAGAGGRYSWKGICGCATRIDAGDRPREIYHFQGPDGASVCMKWNSHEGASALGGYAEARHLTTAVEYLDSDPGFLSRWAWPISAAFGYGADDLQTTTDAFIQASLALSDSTRRVIVSNQIDFFEDFLAHHGDEIPTFSGGFGNEWDLYTASMGEVTADFKRHVEKLRAAEALATVASLHDADFMTGREVERDSAFLACGLFYEHDWTADGPVPKARRARFQRDRLADLVRYVDRLHDDALAAVVERVSQPAGAERHLVFNPLSWTRTDVADLAATTPAPLHVVDVASGSEVPSEIVSMDGSPRVRILASDVPSVGYRTYEVRPGPGANFPPSATVALPEFENSRYRVRLGASGRIVSLKHLEDGGRELVDVVGGRALHDLGSGGGSVTVEHQGPVSTTLRVIAGGSPRHETRVTLYADIDRVDVEGLVTENFGGSVAYEYAFDLDGAIMRHEEVGMIARVARADQGGDYANENTRTDYLTFNHFVDLSLPDRGVTLSNWDSPFFKAGASGTTVLDGAPRIRAVVGMQVDGPTYGIPNQGGDTRLLNRFALRAHGPYDPASAMRFALEHQNPLVPARVAGTEGSPLPADRWSLMALPSPDVLLWALKPSEEGIRQGVIARVWNLADQRRGFGLSLPGSRIESARHATHIETDLLPANVLGAALFDTLERQQLRTYRLIVGGTTDTAPRSDADVFRLAIHPNPAVEGAETTLDFSLSGRERVRVSVHDVRGATIAILVDEARNPGPHRVRWNGRDASGRSVRPGVYFVRLAAEEGRAVTRRHVRLK